MTILIINGSPRKNGATAAILHTMEKYLLQRENVFVEFVDISDLEMASCKGCCACYKTGQCYMNDDAEKLSNRIGAADGLIIGSPTYASNVSGQLKQFIDRGHFVIEQLLHNKYAISVVTGENYGSSDASKALTKLLRYSGAKLSGKITYNLPFNENPNDNHRLTKKIDCLTDKIYNDIKQKKKYFFQYLTHRAVFAAGIRPFVIRKGESYEGVISRWNRNGITIS